MVVSLVPAVIHKAQHSLSKEKNIEMLIFHCLNFPPIFFPVSIVWVVDNARKVFYIMICTSDKSQTSIK